MRPKKSLGQNFLVDELYIRRIVDGVAPMSGDTVVEIGPGNGALTEPLVLSGAHIIAIELDRELARILRDRFRNDANLTVIEADVLSIDFRKLMPTGGGRLRVVANLPYYISTAVLQRLIEFRECFSDLTLMFQLEVVERIMAEPATSTRGYLTVLVEAFFECQKLFDVPPNAFRPPPKVASAVVRLTPTNLDDFDLESLRTVASAAFAHKRKTILNNLKSLTVEASSILTAAGIDGRRRAETLTRAEWAVLINAWRATIC